MFKRTCAFCHVTIEVPILGDLGLKTDYEHVKINEERRNDKKPMKKYEKELEEYNKKRDKIKLGEPPETTKIIKYSDDYYSLGEIEIVNVVRFYKPKIPIVELLAERYIECKICGHRYYIDGKNIYGF